MSSIMQKIFELIHYSEFISKQRFKYKNENLSNDYLQIFNVIIKKTLNDSKSNLKEYALSRLQYFPNNQDTDKAVNKIKKHFIFGNKIDYRYLLFAQIWRYCQILDISIGDLEYIRKTLKFSKKDFEIAKKSAFSLKDIKDKNVLKSFDEFNKFIKLTTQYKNKSIKHLGICANMSSGKSTFVNALLGYDYLPARNEATTACVTSVYDCDFASKALGIAIKENQIYDINDNINANTIDQYNNKADYIILQADLDNISNLNAILAVHDTPGINNSLTDAHRATTMDFFSKNKMDMIIYIYSQCRAFGHR